MKQVLEECWMRCQKIIDEVLFKLEIWVAEVWGS